MVARKLFCFAPFCHNGDKGAFEINSRDTNEAEYSSSFKQIFAIRFNGPSNNAVCFPGVGERNMACELFIFFKRNRIE